MTAETLWVCLECFGGPVTGRDEGAATLGIEGSLDLASLEGISG